MAPPSTPYPFVTKSSGSSKILENIETFEDLNSILTLNGGIPANFLLASIKILAIDV